MGMNELLILATVNGRAALYESTADEYAAVAPNLHLGLLSSFVRARGIHVEVVDCEQSGMTMSRLAEYVNERKPPLIGIICIGVNPSSSTMTFSSVVDFFTNVWLPNGETKTFLWGPHPTALPRRSLDETGADFVVRGEGYEALYGLYHAVLKGADPTTVAGLAFYDTDGSYIQTADPPLIDDVNSLPAIDWKETNPARYRCHNWHAFGDLQHRSPYAIVWTSFGCPFGCTFCCIRTLFFNSRRQRCRSIEKVVEEITELANHHCVRKIRIYDELFVVDEARIDEFCDRLESKRLDVDMWCYGRLDTVTERMLVRLKAVGMNWISYGFETATAPLLDKLHKGTHTNVDDVVEMTKRAGMAICADVMFGVPGEDMTTMQRTYDFCVRHDFEWVNMYPFFRLPGTTVFDESTAPTTWKAYALYGYDCVPAGTEHLSPAEVLGFRDDAFARYHSRPEYLAMIEQRFGTETKEHLRKMLHTKLRRRILEEANRG